VLGALAAVTGLVNMVPVQKLTGAPIDFLHQWLDLAPEELGTAVHRLTGEEGGLTHEFAGYAAADVFVLLPAALSLGLALSGAGLAYRLYGGDDPERHTDRLGSAKTLLERNYYQDEYQVWIAESVGAGVARVADRFDQGVLDGVVNGVSSASLFSGQRIKRLQTGVVTTYASLIAVALVVILVAMALLGGWF
jgi:NADH-quinone oxidoreductase subunit L